MRPRYCFLIFVIVVFFANLACPPPRRNTVPDGFRPHPTRPDKVIGDETELSDNTTPGPMLFQPTEESETPPLTPQGNPVCSGLWNHNDIPRKIQVSNNITAWIQRLSVQSFTRDGRFLRGGQFIVHFKWNATDDNPCEGGVWRQIVRETIYVSDDGNDFMIAELKDGRYVPKDPQPDPPESGKGQWEIDTNQEGHTNNDPNYPNQHQGEMIDSPDRNLSNLQGYYTNDTPPRDPAKAIKKEVEFLTFFVDPQGNVCGAFKWSFTVVWEKTNSTDNDVRHANVNTTFEDPTNIDLSTDEGREAVQTLQAAMARFP